jgi:phytoene dehydrogenase-like protein
MSAYFTEPRLKAAFTFQDVYMGLSPFEAPATFSMMPYTELAHGVFYPEGGMYRVVEALMEIAREAGVEFVFDAGVDRIDVNGTHARGVVMSDGYDRKPMLLWQTIALVYQQLLQTPIG